VTVARDAAGRDIVEHFTFRANGREVTVDDAVIDLEAPRTQIASSVAAALRVGRADGDDAESVDRPAAADGGHPCVVAWTIYEAHGYRSLLSVVCPPGAERTIIGADFLAPHQLRVDAGHGGLVGWAPPNATPLTGGGYVLDAARGDVLERNRARFEAAEPGELLRPHPAWRFTVPVGMKTRPAPAQAAPGALTNGSTGLPHVAPLTNTDAGATAPGAGGPERKWICEWRSPVVRPLAALVAALGDAIAVAERQTRVDPACRLHQWRRQLTALARQDRRAVAERAARGILGNLTRRREAGEAGEPSDDVALTALWDFPDRDAYRSLLEARMFVQVVDRLAPRLHPPDWAKLVSGALRPEDEGANAPHRDHLLELYVAAVADAAGMAVELAQGPDPTANPDVIVDVAGERVGIAAKRLGSRSRVLRNARKAAAQIEASSVERGLVFLDVSNVMNRNAAAIRYLRPPGTPDSGSVLGHLLRFGSEHPELKRLIELPHVEGVVLRHAVPAMLAKSFIPATLETWSPVVEQPSPLTIAVFGGLIDALAPSSAPPTVGPSGYAPCEFAYVHP
jgi:hypothetical protein